MKGIIALVLIQNFVYGQIQVPAEDGLYLFNNMMRYLFDNCGTKFGTIGFWGNNRIFLADDEADSVLLNRSEVFTKSPTRRIKFLVKIYEGLYPHRPIINLFESVPTLEIETVFVFDEGGLRPTIMFDEFLWYQNLFENSKVYYCFVQHNEIVILTINAFADIAPTLWTRSQYFIKFNGSFIRRRILKTIYNKETKFNNGVNFCKNLFFDRTEKVNGYNIRAAARKIDYIDPQFIRIHGFITKTTETSAVTLILNIREGLFSKLLTDYLDVTIEITHGMPYHISLDTGNLILERRLEINLTPTTWSNNYRNFDTTNCIHLSYPFHFFYEQIVTHNRGLASPLEKMFEYYGWLTPGSTLIFLLIASFVIYLSNRENYSRLSFALFECLRLMIGNSIYTRMDTVKMRIFFSVIFLYFLIIQATFSGHLAAFLTKPVYRKNVEILEDLEDSRYTQIYARTENSRYIKDTPLYNKTTFGEGDCEKYIHDPSVACIDQKSYLLDLIPRYNLHTPKNFVKFDYAVLAMPHNWALKHRVDNVLMRLAQSGILDVWNRVWLESNEKKARYHIEKMKDIAENYHRPIELQDVAFAFYLLGVGLFFAIICFTVEYSIKIYTLNKKKMRMCSSKVKWSTLLSVRFVIFEFRRLFKWLYNSLIKIIGWVGIRI